MANNSSSDDPLPSGTSMDTSEAFYGYKNIDDLSQAVLKSVMGAVRSSNELPISGDDFDFCSSFSSYQQYLGVQGTRLLQLIQSSMRYHGARGSMSANSELTDVEDRFDVLVDTNDQLLETVSTLLDEASGLRKKEADLVVVTKTPKQTTATGGWNKKIAPVSGGSTGKYRLLTARNIRRPQVQFKDKIDNSDRPFVPKLIEKPNALKSLEDSLQCDVPADNDPSFCYPHPYQLELNQFAPDASWLEAAKPQQPKSIEATPLTMIDTEHELLKLCKILKAQTEIAVDLEAHSYRSYLGFACLIQISTRVQDYIIDALALREHLHLLNDSFTDPKILKVLHGADQDVMWLQRDFGVYIVGLFDTHQGSRSMAFHRHRLQDLLWHYCSVETNKEYQLEDWRIRPLPEDFLLYARMDTHYLLYIYDCLRNDLLHRSNEHKNILMSVYDRSTQICYKKYMKPIMRDDSYKDLLIAHRKVFNAQQMAALKGLYAWRDDIARQVDESSGFVLPNLMMLQMAELLPREPEGILACCSNIPPLVQENLLELHRIIKDARITKKEESKVTAQSATVLTPLSANKKAQYCPHDMSHQSDAVDDPNLYKDGGLEAVQSKLFDDEFVDEHVKSKPILTAIVIVAPIRKKTKAQKRADAIKQSLLNPFSKYMPLSGDDKATVQSVVSASETNELWKLMPNTVKKASNSTSNPRLVEVVKTASLVLFDETQTVEQKTVRQQLTSEKKQPLQCDVVQSAPSAKKQKHKADKAAARSANNEQFVAHDYTKSNFKMMMNQDNPGKSTTKKNAKKRDFDPTSSLAECDIKGVPRKRPLLHTPSNKNLTYGTNVEARQVTPKIPWPKK